MRSTEILIATAKLEWVRNGGVLDIATTAKLAEHGLIVDELLEQFEDELGDTL
jgi:hypothetical protein